MISRSNQPPASALRYGLFTLALTAVGWLAAMLWPQVLLKLGIYDYGARFLDSYAVMAALDAVRAGADPHTANPLDVLMRYHVYSDWWLGLRWLGLTRAHNFWVGATWVVGFALAAILTMRPRRLGEALWLVSLLVSPVVCLSVDRANADLVIFVLLGGCGLAAAAGGWRLWIALGCLVLATGLKYYPVVAVLPFLWVRPVRMVPMTVCGALILAGLTMASVWSQIDRALFPLGVGVYTMGAPVWWLDHGWTKAQSMLPGLFLLATVAWGCARFKLTVGLAEQGDLSERILAAMGATVILVCFLSGINFAYRWIFALWPAFWLWRRMLDISLPDRSRFIAGLGCGLIALAFWQDGLFCLAINSLSPRSQAWIDEAQHVFRLWNQPLQWLLMGLLGGWLLEAVPRLLRAAWQHRSEA